VRHLEPNPALLDHPPKSPAHGFALVLRIEKPLVDGSFAGAWVPVAGG
jgi:hypothetical protein